MAKMHNRIVYVGTWPDGSQIFVERWLDDDGNEVAVAAAMRPRADTSLPWGPPIELVRE